VKRTRTPDSHSSCPRERARRSPMPWFGWMNRHIPFSEEGRRGARRAKPLLPRHLARSTAGSEHDASNRNLQSTNRYVCSRVARCTRFGRAGPARRIRRAPWRSPDLVRSGPSRVTPAFEPLRRGSDTATDGSSSDATRPILHRRVSRSTADPFSRRELSSPIHESRPAARTPGALASPHSLFGPRE
jgi:hypothetical protein